MKQKALTILLLVITANVIYFGLIRGRFAPRNPFDKSILLDEQQQPFSIAAQKGKVVIVTYFQTWCGDCRKELPQLEILRRDFKDKLLVLVITDESFEKIKAVKSFMQIDLPFYQSQKSLRQIGIHRFPTTYLLDKNGEVVESKVEGIQWNTIEIRDLISELSQ